MVINLVKALLISSHKINVIINSKKGGNCTSHSTYYLNNRLICQRRSYIYPNKSKNLLALNPSSSIYDPLWINKILPAEWQKSLLFSNTRNKNPRENSEIILFGEMQFSAKKADQRKKSLFCSLKLAGIANEVTATQSIALNSQVLDGILKKYR